MKNGTARPNGIQPGLDHRSSYRFSRLAALHARAFSAVCASRFKLTANTWMILTVIGRFGPLSGNVASAHSSLEPDKVTRAVDALVRQGYVRRRQDSSDRRKVILSLSVRGQRVHDELNRLRDIIEHEFLRDLSPTEVAALYGILDKLEITAAELFSDRRTLAAIVNEKSGPGRKRPRTIPRRRIRPQAEQRASRS